jgi:hypothetical protein
MKGVAILCHSWNIYREWKWWGSQTQDMVNKRKYDNTSFDADAAHAQRHFSTGPLLIFS